MSNCQPGILLAPPAAGHYLAFRLARPDAAPAVLAALGRIPVGDALVVGLGEPLVRALGVRIPGLRCFPSLAAPGAAFPAEQHAVWAYVRGNEPGDALDRARAVRDALGADVVLTEDVASYTYRGGRDLTGYEDGTENPVDEAAIACALVTGAGEGLDGGSFVATQRWVHDLEVVRRMSPHVRDAVMGRALESNEEIADAPPSAHVKRAAQESFDPPAFMLRRSMPYGTVAEHGLYFVAFGESLDRYERVLRRMAGLEDGIPDALLRFSRAVSGAYYWCPPVWGERLDLRALGTAALGS